MTGRSDAKGGTAVARSKGRVSASDLSPDLGSLAPEAAVSRKPFWLGIIHERRGPDGKFHRAPSYFTNIGVATFQRYYEPVTGQDDSGRQQRAHYSGRVFSLSREEVEHIADVIARTYVRWRSRDGKKAHGHFITLKSPEEVEVAKAAGTFRPYTPDERDEPAANWLYMVPASVPGIDLPAPVSETGIDLP